MDDPMNAAPREEAPYEADLRAALKVDPSPEFLARVRTRVAAEPEPSRWRLAWVMGLGLTAAVLVVMVWPRSEAPAPARVQPVPAPVAAADPAPVVAPRPERIEAAPVRDVRRVVPDRQAPVIVVDTAEVAAFERLVARIEMGSLPAGPAAVTPPEMAAEIQFEPVEIAPIVFASAGEGGDVQ